MVASPPCLIVVTEAFTGILDVSGEAPPYAVTGVLVVLLNIITQHLGLCYEFVVPEERLYGTPLPNGSWTGMIGMLQRGEADLGGTLFSISSERWQVLDFSEAIMVDEMSAFHLRPSVSSDMAGFVKPYTYQVWLLVILSGFIIFIVGLLLNMTLRSERSSHLDGDRRTDTLLEHANNVSLWTWSFLLAQSATRVPEGTWPRAIAGLWLLSALIIGSAYRSNLKAMLIIPRVNLPFDSLEELTESAITTAILKDSTVHADILAADENTALWKLRHQMQLFPGHEVVHAIAGVVQGHGAGVAMRAALSAILNGDYSRVGKCRAYIMSQGFLGPRSVSFAYPKHSPLEAPINKVIVQLRESGILTKVMSQALANATDCLKPVSSVVTTPQLRPLELGDFYGVLLLYFAGMVAGIMVFLVEQITIAKDCMTSAGLQCKKIYPCMQK